VLVESAEDPLEARPVGGVEVAEQWVEEGPSRLGQDLSELAAESLGGEDQCPVSMARLRSPVVAS
jgi:hypothetical protein